MTLIRLLVSMVVLAGIGMMSPAASVSQDEGNFEIRLSDEFKESVERNMSFRPSLGERRTDHSLTEAIEDVQRQPAAMDSFRDVERFDPSEHARNAMARADMIRDRLWADFPRYGEERWSGSLQAENPQENHVDWRKGIPRHGSVNSLGNETAWDDGQVHRSMPFLAFVGGIGTAGIKGLGLVAVIPVKLRPLLAGGAFGTATGYGLTQVFDTDYGWKNAIIDFGVGAATGPVILAMGRTLAKLTRISKIIKIPDDIVYKTYDSANVLGETSATGGITIKSSLKGTSEALDTYKHELVHQTFTPPAGSLFATQRQALMMWGYRNSYLLRGLEEGLAQGIAKDSLIEGFKYPIMNGAFCKTAESWVIIEDKGVELTGQAVFA